MVRRVQTTRRAAVGTLLSVGAGFGTGSFLSGSQKNSISDKLNVAIVGAGKGSIGGIANLPAMSDENVVAICDVDDHYAGPAREANPQAR